MPQSLMAELDTWPASYAVPALSRVFHQCVLNLCEPYSPYL